MAKLGGARPVETTPCLGNSHRKWQNWLEVETVADRRYNVQNFNVLPQGSEDMKSISTITAQNSMGSDISQPQQVTKEEVKMWTINGSHSSEHTTTGANFEGKINQPTLWTQPWTNLFCLDLGGARPCESITQLQSGATRKVSFAWIGVLSHLSTQLAQKKMRPADRQACIEMVNVAQREQHGDRTTSWQWTKSRLHPLSLELFLLDDNFGRFEVGAILFYACADKSHLCCTLVMWPPKA